MYKFLTNMLTFSRGGGGFDQNVSKNLSPHMWIVEALQAAWSWLFLFTAAGNICD